MKRIILLSLSLLAFTAIHAQVLLPKGVIVGTGATKATLSVDEMKTLDGTTSNIQTQLDSKAAASGVYTKAQSDALVAPKANSADVYTKTEVNNLVSPKANSTDVYTKAQTDALVAPKANSADVYLKTQTYTQTETNNLLTPKANSSDVYTKTETNNLVSPKANSADVYTRSQVYTKTEADAITNTKANTSTTYTKTEVDGINTAIQTELDTKVNIADGVAFPGYTTTQTDSLLKIRTPGMLEYLKTRGSTVKTCPVGASIWGSLNSAPLVDGYVYVHSLWPLPYATTLSSVRFVMYTQGDYTPDNENRIGIYRLSGSTFTLVAATANSTADPNMFEGAQNTLVTANFATPYTTAPNEQLFIAVLYNSSAQTTAPTLVGTNQGRSIANDPSFLGTSTYMSGRVFNTQTALPASFTTGDLINNSLVPFILIF